MAISKTQSGLRFTSSNDSLLDCREGAEVMLFNAEANFRPVFPAHGDHADVSRGVGARKTAIFGIVTPSHNSKIPEPVVGTNTVDVVNLPIGLRPMDHLPHQSVHVVEPTVQSEADVSAWGDAPGLLPCSVVVPAQSHISIGSRAGSGAQITALP